MKYTTWQALILAGISTVSFAGRRPPDPQTGRTTISPAATSTDALLSRWAEALGGSENLQNVRTIHLQGTIETSGMKGRYERWTTAGGELRTVVDLSGAYRQTAVFDGKQGWIQDASGTVHELTGDMFRSLVSSAYEASDSFLFSGRLSGRVEFVAEDAGQGAYVLRLEPENGTAVTVFLDKVTFLPQREESSGPMDKRVVVFSDWREFGTIRVPGTIRQSNGDARFDALIKTEQVEINAAVSAGLFEKPESSAEPILFANGVHQAVVSAVLTGDHIYLPVRVNGGEPAWFFFDTGAGMSVVSQAWAQKMGLRVEGAVQVKGTGAGSSSVGLAKQVSLGLPGLRVPPGTVAVWDLSTKVPMLGRRWDGVLGYDVISRLVVRVDYQGQQLTFYDPATFVADDRATALPITFLRNMPVVHVKITLPGRAPVDAECVVDSGADGFHLTAPFTNANHVLESVAKTISASSVGAGGETKEYAGRIASLQLGPYVLREPIATFSPDEHGGLLASSDIGAILGGRILRRFTVTFDYLRQRMLLEPNGHFDEPFRANESGLSLLGKGVDFHRFEVDGVEPSSPADVAGMKIGDLLTAINGRPARELDLQKIDEILQQAGHTISVTVLRNGRRMKMALLLRERI